jgi:hypothetical protein
MHLHVKKRLNLLAAYVAPHLLPVFLDYMRFHQPVNHFLRTESALFNYFNKVRLWQ